MTWAKDHEDKKRLKNDKRDSILALREFTGCQGGGRGRQSLIQQCHEYTITNCDS